MEKRTEIVQTRLTKSEKCKLNETVFELKEKGYQSNINSSDLIRQAIQKWIYIHEKIESGNTLCFMTVSKEITDNKISMIELETLSNDENLSNHTRKILSEMASRLEWEVLGQLKEKYPDYDGFFDTSSLDKDI